MKIIIVSYHCAPEITPRAFRATSLLKSLKILGHDVELIAPEKEQKNPSFVKEDSWLLSKIKTKCRKLIEIVLPGGKDLKYFRYFLRKLKGRESDIVISIGLPFSVHLATAVAVRFCSLTAKSIIFDYGDPYSANPNGSSCFYAKKIETWALKYCDQVLTPIKEAVPLFQRITGDTSKVHVVPQGYNLLDVKILEYKKNRIPTFCFAGLLYKKIREPSRFFEYLCALEHDFRFIVYTDTNNSDVREIIGRYQERLRHKLVVKNMIPRDLCIAQLSAMDFLVNFNNTGGVQQPSKLVDYTLSERPFLSVSSEQISFDSFDLFLQGEYSTFERPDISDFDEIEVAKKIIFVSKAKLNES